MQRSIILVAHNVRSTHNVGSLLRTADGLGVEAVYVTGYTPYPAMLHDQRLPHIADKLDHQIHKTALGAEKTVAWQHREDIGEVLATLRRDDYEIVGLEQADNSVALPDWSPPERVAIIIGREVQGLEPEVIQLCDKLIEIPMFGKKESFNVVQAAAMALYHTRFSDSLG